MQNVVISQTNVSTRSCLIKDTIDHSFSFYSSLDFHQKSLESTQAFKNPHHSMQKEDTCQEFDTKSD